jgi:hypothetical protein
MVFENGVKNIQAAAYNGVRTVYKREKKSPELRTILKHFK